MSARDFNARRSSAPSRPSYFGKVDPREFTPDVRERIDKLAGQIPRTFLESAVAYLLRSGLTNPKLEAIRAEARRRQQLQRDPLAQLRKRTKEAA